MLLCFAELRQGVGDAHYLHRFGGVHIAADVQVEVDCLYLGQVGDVGEALDVLEGPVADDYFLDVLRVDEVMGLSRTY